MSEIQSKCYEALESSGNDSIYCNRIIQNHSINSLSEQQKRYRIVNFLPRWHPIKDGSRNQRSMFLKLKFKFSNDTILRLDLFNFFQFFSDDYNSFVFKKQLIWTLLKERYILFYRSHGNYFWIGKKRDLSFVLVIF